MNIQGQEFSRSQTLKGSEDERPQVPLQPPEQTPPRPEQPIAPPKPGGPTPEPEPTPRPKQPLEPPPKP